MQESFFALRFLSLWMPKPSLVSARPSWPVQEIDIGFLFRNSLLPKTLGSGVDFGFFELCSLFNNFRKSVGDFSSPFKEMDVSKGFATMFNQVFFVLSRQHAFLMLNE